MDSEDVVFGLFTFLICNSHDISAVVTFLKRCRGYFISEDAVLPFYPVIAERIRKASAVEGCDNDLHYRISGSLRSGGGSRRATSEPLKY